MLNKRKKLFSHVNSSTHVLTTIRHRPKMAAKIAVCVTLLTEGSIFDKTNYKVTINKFHPNKLSQRGNEKHSISDVILFKKNEKREGCGTNNQKKAIYRYPPNVKQRHNINHC